jgi:hypothetical protein
MVHFFLALSKLQLMCEKQERQQHKQLLRLQGFQSRHKATPEARQVFEETYSILAGQSVDCSKPLDLLSCCISTTYGVPQLWRLPQSLIWQMRRMRVTGLDRQLCSLVPASLVRGAQAAPATHALFGSCCPRQDV